MDIAHYDRLWSSDWQAVQAVGPLTHTRYRLLSALIPRSLPDSPDVLDVGCGRGAFLQFLGRTLTDARLQGIEPSIAAIESADPAIRGHILHGTLDRMSMRLDLASQDLIVCSEVLEHVEHPERDLQTLFSLLRPGGSVLLSVPAGMRHWSAQDEVAGHLRRFEFDAFRALLGRTGFVVDELYGWGGPIATAYNRLVNAVGPERVMRSGSTAPAALAARALVALLRLDDRFRSERAFQLIAAAHRPRR